MLACGKEDVLEAEEDEEINVLDVEMTVKK
jgi:hypothetical protein